MNPRRMANLLNVTPELLREFLAHLSKPDDEIVTLYADGRALKYRFFDAAELCRPFSIRLLPVRDRQLDSRFLVCVAKEPDFCVLKIGKAVRGLQRRIHTLLSPLANDRRLGLG
jgi:hypothetical protein